MTTTSTGRRSRARTIVLLVGLAAISLLGATVFYAYLVLASA